MRNIGNVDSMKAREKIFSISIGVTGRCNLNCTYCHYFKSRSRNKFAYDISDEQFIAYLNFIRAWNLSTQSPTSYRFSGGEPMILGDRLFDLANKAFDVVGTSPYILSAGKILDQDWILKARDSAISHIFLSIENPVNPDRGSVDPIKLAKRINKYNSKSLPVIPGVCVVPNNCFAKLHEICRWFYEEMGKIPLICEVNYGAYKTPSEEEWKQLEENLNRVVEDFFSKVHLNLFSSIIPEYAYGGIDPYLFELDLENSHKINNHNISEKIAEIKTYVKTKSYPMLLCKQDSCPWINFCKNTKWYWQNDERLSRSEKLLDYCRFKRIVSDAYYRILVDSNHPNTTCSIG